MRTAPSNTDDVIDSRDVIARIEELEGERADAATALAEWDASDEGEELKVLKALADQGEGYGDWDHGETLIRESYFQDYAQELAEDCDIIALFPEVAGNSNPSTCQSYMHVGQHGAADPHLPGSRLAAPREYASLLAELKRQGYDDLKVCKRISPRAYLIRRAQL